MTPGAINEGEAMDLRSRLGTVETRSGENERRMDVHEEKCAGRYRIIIALGLISIAMQAPSAWPHIATLLGMVK
jgi:hypothetical protein